MTGRTHIAFGISVSFLVMQPRTISDVAVCATGAAIGASICDIDIASNSRKQFERVSLLVACAVFLLVQFNKTAEVSDYLQRNPDALKITLCSLLFFLICQIGMKKPHRTFMHSIVSVGILGALVWQIYAPATLAFSIGMASHIASDLTNMKKIQVFYPLKKRVCFHLFHADGYANDLLFWWSISMLVRWAWGFAK